MKATIIQPPYSNDPADADRFFAFKLDQLAACDESDDLVVLPEYSDVPCPPLATLMAPTASHHHWPKKLEPEVIIFLSSYWNRNRIFFLLRERRESLALFSSLWTARGQSQLIVLSWRRDASS